MSVARVPPVLCGRGCPPRFPGRLCGRMSGLARCESDSVKPMPVCTHPFVLWLIAAGRVFGGSATDASSYLLDQPLQIGWQGHAVDVGDIGGAQLDLGVAKSPHRAFQPERAARALVNAEQ